MSDARLRDCERRWRETGSVEDEATYLGERVRCGLISQDELDLAAIAGHPAAARGARAFTRPDPEHRGSRPHAEFSGWIAALGARDVSVALESLTAALTAAIPPDHPSTGEGYLLRCLHAALDEQRDYLRRPSAERGRLLDERLRTSRHAWHSPGIELFAAAESLREATHAFVASSRWSTAIASGCRASISSLEMAGAAAHDLQAAGSRAALHLCFARLHL